MPISIGHRKVPIDTMKTYHKQRQYIYRHCQPGYVTPGNALLISVCFLLLPVMRLTAEHVQIATVYQMTSITQLHVLRHHMILSHTLPLLSNVLPAMVLHNCVVKLNIGCPLHTSFHFRVSHIPFSQCPNHPFSLGKMVVGVVLALLLLLSGDIETNPGPVGEFFLLP